MRTASHLFSYSLPAMPRSRIILCSRQEAFITFGIATSLRIAFHCSCAEDECKCCAGVQSWSCAATELYRVVLLHGTTDLLHHLPSCLAPLRQRFPVKQSYQPCRKATRGHSVVYILTSSFYLRSMPPFRVLDVRAVSITAFLISCSVVPRYSCACYLHWTSIRSQCVYSRWDR